MRDERRNVVEKRRKGIEEKMGNEGKKGIELRGKKKREKDQRERERGEIRRSVAQAFNSAAGP